MARTQTKKNKVIAALSEVAIIDAACKKAGIARATYYRWLRDDPAFVKDVENAIKEGDDRINGLAESKLIGMIKAGNLPATRYWLNNRSKRFSHQGQRPQKQEEVQRTEPVKIFDMRTGVPMKMVPDEDAIREMKKRKT
jgi:Helix-turn-helix of insertion element transposase